MAKSNYDYVKAWRARPENKSKRNEEAQRWRAKHPDVIKAIKARHREANLDAIRAKDVERQREYRKTPQYKEAQARRNQAFKQRQREERERIAGRPCPEVCELCGGNEGGICFDHCHKHGHFRGWICDRCNKVLGLVRDNAELLVAMAT
ncbi:MAG: endonuclease domain-containing protein, partial [Candidatus Binataceae bacterium]